MISVEHFQDNGRACVSVTLKNYDKPALLYQDDWNRLIEAGIDPRWKLKNSQIVTQGRKPVSITRLVAEAAKGAWVTLIDGNPCNLKRSNIVIGRRKETAKPTDLLTHKFHNPYYMKEILNELRNQNN